jgi:hypothetical protein
LFRLSSHFQSILAIIRKNKETEGLINKTVTSTNEQPSTNDPSNSDCQQHQQRGSKVVTFGGVIQLQGTDKRDTFGVKVKQRHHNKTKSKTGRDRKTNKGFRAPFLAEGPKIKPHNLSGFRQFLTRHMAYARKLRL